MSISYPANVGQRIAATLFVTQSIASAALFANVTVNPILGAQLSGNDALAGLPGTLLLIGAASAAYPMGQLMERYGRRHGLALGFFLGVIGMTIGGIAVITRTFLLFLAGLLLIGGARGATDQSRYAAADAQLPDRRAKAISMVVFASTIGGIGGPALVAPLGILVGYLGFPPLAGPMFGGALLFLVAGVLIAFFLRPDPRDIGRALAASDHHGHQIARGPARPLREIMRQPGPQLALASMVIGQVVMVLIMTVTSLHMHHHDHGLGEVSLVIMAHTFGMFGFSFFTGSLADRIGRKASIGIGAFILIIGALTAPLSFQTPWLALALFLVGLGWNLCYIAGSSLLSDTLAPSERAQVQGANELVINLASATSSLSSGFIMAALGFTILCMIGLVLSLLPLILLGWQGMARSRIATNRV